MRNIVCIGASTGGLAALEQLLRRVPSDLPAAIFIVRHIAPDGNGLLPEIMQPVCALPVANAVDGEPIENGRVYVAPPNRHLLLDRKSVMVVNGPKENWARPAIDPLFRSAAQYHGPKSIGIVLSGKLDDGTAGLWALKRRGGMTVVQTPGTAGSPDMPNHALAAVDVDVVADAEEIGTLLPRWCRESTGYAVSDLTERVVEVENSYLLHREKEQYSLNEIGFGAGIVCPDCGGQLWQMREGPLRYRCHVGHGYSAHSLLMQQGVEIETAGWRLVRALEEDISLSQRILAEARPGLIRKQVEVRLARSERNLEQIRPLVTEGIVQSPEQTSLDAAAVDRFDLTDRAMKAKPTR